MGIKIRLVTKPGESLHSTGLLPISMDISKTLFVVSSSVFLPRTTSTSFIMGTGFMKCMPITFSGRDVTSAIAVMEMDDVLVARIASVLQTLSMDVNIFLLQTDFQWPLL